MQEAEVREKVEKIEDYLCSQFFEREDEIQQILACVFISENFFLLGPPGTAKSELIKVLFEDCVEGGYSYHLLTKSLPPDSVLGPIDLEKFKEENEEKHDTEGYLPDAEWGGLDEAWKSNDTLLNNLLSILNEGIFRNGKDVEECPLRSAVAMSNELPQQEILEALYDRFLLRLVFDPVSNSKNFKKILDSDRDEFNPPEKLTLDELDFIQEEIEQVSVEGETYEEYFNLREDINNIEDADIYVSDRRFKQAFTFLKSIVWMKGHDTVTKDDFSRIENCLWSEPKHKRKIQRVLMNYFSPAVDKVQSLYNEITANIETAYETQDFGEVANIYMNVKKKKEEFDQYVKQQEGTKHYPRLKEVAEKLQPKVDSIKDYYKSKMD